MTALTLAPPGRLPRLVRAPAARPRPDRTPTRGRVARVIAGVLFTVLVATGIGLSTQPAHAIFGITTCTFVPEATGGSALRLSGAGTSASKMLLPDPGKYLTPGTPVDPVPYNQLTVYELLGGQGQTWSTYSYNEAGDEECSILDTTANMLATAALGINDAIVDTAILAFAISTSPNGIYSSLYTTSGSVAQRLFDGLDQPLFVSLIMLIGIIAILRSFKARGDSGLRETITDVGVAMVFMLILFYLIPGGGYLTQVQNADQSASTISGDISSAVLGIQTLTTDDPCYLPGGSENAGRRQMACEIWKVHSFTPWSLGQFGAAGEMPVPYAGDDNTHGKFPHDARFQQLWLQTFDKNEAIINDPSLGVDPTTMPYSGVAKEQAWEKFAQYVRGVANGDSTGLDPGAVGTWASIYPLWRGEGASQRFAVVGNAIGGTLITSSSVIVGSALNMIWQFVPVALQIALPLVLLLGMLPFLRRLAKHWAQMLGKSYVMRVAIAIAVAVLLASVQAIITTTSDPGSTFLMEAGIAVSLLMTFRLVKNVMDESSDGGASIEDHARGIGAKGAAVIGAGAGLVAGGVSRGRDLGRKMGERHKAELEGRHQERMDRRRAGVDDPTGFARVRQDHLTPAALKARRRRKLRETGDVAAFEERRMDAALARRAHTEQLDVHQPAMERHMRSQTEYFEQRAARDQEQAAQQKEDRMHQAEAEGLRAAQDRIGRRAAQAERDAAAAARADAAAAASLSERERRQRALRQGSSRSGQARTTGTVSSPTVGRGAPAPTRDARVPESVRGGVALDTPPVRSTPRGRIRPGQ